MKFYVMTRIASNSNQNKKETKNSNTLTKVYLKNTKTKQKIINLHDNAARNMGNIYSLLFASIDQ